MTAPRKLLEVVDCWFYDEDDFHTAHRAQPAPFGNAKITQGTWINTTKRELLDAFHEVYLQGQRDKENNVLSAPNLFNILGLKE